MENMAVDLALAQASKQRKDHKQLKRVAARARRVAIEGVNPDELWCSTCGAHPGDYCRSPDGRFLSRFPSNHESRRRTAELEKAKIFEAGRKARDRLAAEYPKALTANTLSLTRIRQQLTFLRSAFGSVEDRYRTLIEDLYLAPTTKKWGFCHGIVLAPTTGFGLTLWKALIAVDPDNTPREGPLFAMGEECRWDWAPTSSQVEQAIAYAVGAADDEQPKTVPKDPETGPQPSLW